MDSGMQSTALSRATRWGMMATGLLQGLVCYVLFNWLAPVNHDWLFYGLPASLAISSILLLTVVSFKQRALWGWLAGIAALVLAMSYWLKQDLTGLSQWRIEEALWIFGWQLLCMALLGLPWLQHRLNAQQGVARYSQFYARMWQNALTMLVCLFINGLVWLVLLLWSRLFELVGITFFDRLFFDTDWFACIAIGTIGALAVILARTQFRLVAAVQKLLTFIAIGLLPMVSLLALMFIVTLPFTGLQAISGHVSAAGLLSTLAMLLLLLMAIVRDPQREWLPYPPVLRCVVKVSLLIAPVYVLIAGWALALRVHQHGWSASRIYGVLVVLVLLVWSLGYLVSIIKRRANPIHFQGKVNQGVSLLACAILLLLHTPVLDPWRIGVNSHMARYHSGKIMADEVSLYMLDHSRKPGRDALVALQKDKEFIKSAKRKKELNSLLTGFSSVDNGTMVETLIKNIEIAPGSTPPDAAFWKDAAESGRYSFRSCSEPASCLMINQDLNGDGQREWVLFAFGAGEMQVYRFHEAKWVNNGWSSLPNNLTKEEVLSVAASGRLTVQPKVWQDLRVGDEQLDIHYSN